MFWAIIGAVEEEVWLIIDNLSQKKETRWNGKSVYEGMIGNHDIVVMATGVGKVKTAASVQYLIDFFSIDAVVFTGVAGALNPDLTVGDIVICWKTAQHDFDIGGKGIPGRMRTPWVMAEPKLVDAAFEIGRDSRNRVCKGVALTGDQTIIDSRKRKWLRQTFQGDCVEMEGAAAAMVCSLNDIPFLLIRAITDHADEHVREDFRKAISQAAIDSATIVLGMLGKLDGVRLFRRTFFFRLKKFIARNVRAALKRLAGTR